MRRNEKAPRSKDAIGPSIGNAMHNWRRSANTVRKSHNGPAVSPDRRRDPIIMKESLCRNQRIRPDRGSIAETFMGVSRATAIYLAGSGPNSVVSSTRIIPRARKAKVK